MKKGLTAALLSLIAIASGATVANASGLADIAGSYNCIDPSSRDNNSQTLIDAKNMMLTVIRGGRAYTGALIDKSELLTPLKRDLGVMQMLVVVDNKPVGSCELLQTKSGLLLITGGGKSLQDKSKSDEMSFHLAPDSVCTLVK